MATSAEHRMLAIRFEEKQLWQDAAKEWRNAIGGLREMKGVLVGRIRAEYHARHRAAEQRAEGSIGYVDLPLSIVEGQAELHEKSHDERNPGAVTHLDAGKNEESVGAR